MSNEVVKYHNDLNTVVMRTWTSEEMNFFFTILTKAKEQGVKKLVFNTDELRELASSSRKYRWEETITNAAKKIGQLTYFEQSERKFRVMTLFEFFEVDLEKKIVEVKVSSNFDYILNKLETQFTRYELEEFTSIRSTYAKTMYRLLKQWRTVGKKEFAIDDLKRILDMPSAYKSSEIDRAVIKPILEQLSPYFVGLKVKKIKSNKRGNPVLGYEFTWNPETFESYVPNKFNKPKHKQERQSNVPSWSNTDYVNTTSEETKAELERKKQEMLARLNRRYLFELHEIVNDSV
ncbi:MAG: RepB family plasmid replication initiator protein [Enterococcus faecalis]|nr:RepB family plasmid replication initiator protein [Enterococcus faecalis]